MGYGARIARNVKEIGAAAFAPRNERRRVARRYVHDALRVATPYIGVETDGLIMFSATRDRTIGRALYTTGWWDRDGLPAVLRAAGLDLRASWVIEVGANIGTTTVQAARLGARVLAFEPEPMNFRLLRANVAANLLDYSVTCVQAGCSSVAGVARLQTSAVNDGEHRVSDTGDVEIALVTLDASLAEHGIDPSEVGLLWVDAEGHEAQVLAGASALLAPRPPVLIEFWPKGLGVDGIRSVTAALSAYSKVVDMGSGAETTLPAAAETYRHGITDLLFLP